MSKEKREQAIVAAGSQIIWCETCSLGIVDDLAAGRTAPAVLACTQRAAVGDESRRS